jgi:hypothetical protein
MPSNQPFRVRVSRCHLPFNSTSASRDSKLILNPHALPVEQGEGKLIPACHCLLVFFVNFRNAGLMAQLADLELKSRDALARDAELG